MWQLHQQTHNAGVSLLKKLKHYSPAFYFLQNLEFLDKLQIHHTPVPLHPTRLRERGFNQAELIAKILAQKINIPLGCALERIRYTTTQTAFDRIERMENLRGAFRLRKKIGVRGLHVLLVDDILTTGSTLSECARVLREAGARSVYAVTAARA